MPQLDPNTFLYQYTGIIILLITVYTLLAFVVLPVILRAMIIRNNFLVSGINRTESFKTLDFFIQRALVLRTPTYINSVANLFFKNFTKLLNTLISYKKSALIVPFLGVSNVLGNSTLSEEAFLIYLTLFFLNDEEINN